MKALHTKQFKSLKNKLNFCSYHIGLFLVMHGPLSQEAWE